MQKLLGFAVLAVLASDLYGQAATKTIVAIDERTQIEVPDGWSVLELNDAAEIQVGSVEDEAYLIVLNEVKDDLYGWNLEKHSRVTLGRLLTNVVFPTVTGPKSLTIAGKPAVQYEIRGGSENRNVIYIHTTVDGENYLSQILAWTLPSRSDMVRPQLLNAINSFREVK
ncbi:MAG TPA: hypothetical protein VNA04_10230 [Thermoanaerobaculia bacterium]|nr:hypothetical protein [Thermoanaerobaculia bacterium]